MKLLWMYFRLHLKSQLQYRGAFLMMMAVQLLVMVTYLVTPYFLVSRFGNLYGWTFAELMLCFVIINTAFAIAEMLARGFDMFSGQIVSGSFDRLLVRPRPVELQVMGSQFEFNRLGKGILTVVMIVWVLQMLPQLLQTGKLLALALMILSGAAVFSGVFILQASLCFWTIQGLEVANIFTNGAQMTAQYPLDIYRKWLRILFTAVIPFGCATYFPLAHILGKPGFQSVWYMLAPLAGFLFLVPCLAMWRFGVGKYLSAGS